MVSVFDIKIKFFDKIRKSFGGGIFNINEGFLLEEYYFFLKREYNEGWLREFFVVNIIGL